MLDQKQKKKNSGKRYQENLELRHELFYLSKEEEIMIAEIKGNMQATKNNGHFKKCSKHDREQINEK